MDTQQDHGLHHQSQTTDFTRFSQLEADRQKELVHKKLQDKIPGHMFDVESKGDPVYQFENTILDEDDFKAKWAAYQSLSDQPQDPVAADDFPLDTETQQDLVKKLVQAMLSLDAARDKRTKKPINRIKKLSLWELELMAWAVLYEIRDIQHGTFSMPLWGKVWPPQKCPTFMDRYRKVEEALRMRKTNVSSLFDNSFRKRICLNPAAECGLKKFNHNLNKKKQYERNFVKMALRSQGAGQLATRSNNFSHSQKKKAVAEIRSLYDNDPQLREMLNSLPGNQQADESLIFPVDNNVDEEEWNAEQRSLNDNQRQEVLNSLGDNQHAVGNDQEWVEFLDPSVETSKWPEPSAIQATTNEANS
ncbi:hypothetical protein J7T55_002062 [Diaporthe amygdali]|uniref:uncharacterized protein n=1 Tax=Phomopsis amygdali TaxID=1214568 RepID=UPI0022FDDE94|nr:uncharacterized protein J7T55_002062 [Diaporthe amygdali]KAJ0108458.1 hypothetical protein J7T55_002062 [Diaporthe amygdali]